MVRRILLGVAALAIIPFLAGADGITMLNAGGGKGTAIGDGTFAPDKGRQLYALHFRAYNYTNKQTTSGPANTKSPNWDGTLALTAGDYNCWGTLATKVNPADPKEQPVYTDSNSKDVVVQ